MTANANDGLAGRGPVFIVGAGPSGLTAAYRLRARGIPAVILEKRDRTGGMIHTHREQGYLMEEGATILPSAYEPVVKLAHEIGSGPDLIPAGSIIGFARDDTIHNLRSDHLFLDVLKTPLVSLKSKALMARFGVDATRASKLLNYEDLSRASAFDTMTPREYCSLHLGLSGEVYDYVINSTVRGVLGVRGDAISNLELFFMLYNILGSKLYAFREGYSTYVDRLSEGMDIRLNTTVQDQGGHRRGDRHLDGRRWRHPYRVRIGRGSYRPRRHHPRPRTRPFRRGFGGVPARSALHQVRGDEHRCHS